MQPLLTIAIPTYNRCEKLKLQLERVIPHLSELVVCKVYDNASTDETFWVASEYANSFLQVHTCHTNLGIGRNFLRCFEECQTPWLWVLSDDDSFNKESLEAVIRMLADTEYDFIHTSSHLAKYEADRIVDSVDVLFEKTNLSALFFISAGFYRMEKLKERLHIFASSISTWVPQTAMLLSALEMSKQSILLSSIELINSAPETPRFSTLDFIIRLASSPESLTREKTKQKLAKQILHEHFQWALLLGLREVTSIDAIMRWKRIYRQSKSLLSLYQPEGIIRHSMSGLFVDGTKRKSFTALLQMFSLSFFNIIPPIVFGFFLRKFPHPDWLRQEILGITTSYKVTKY